VIACYGKEMSSISLCARDASHANAVGNCKKKTRYLRATKWASANVTIERLEGTLKWRREYGVYDLTADMVEPEVSTVVSFSAPGFSAFFFCSWHFDLLLLFGLDVRVEKRPSRESRSFLVMTRFAGPLCT
jgi:hypothetical protein